jgi:hypothetical protein
VGLEVLYERIPDITVVPGQEPEFQEILLTNVDAPARGRVEPVIAGRGRAGRLGLGHRAIAREQLLLQLVHQPG